ncbi:MAG: 3D domain-containing protein [Clostridia bacterium]|nr:3D domain-containing protein [Clostridia bacterium]
MREILIQIAGIALLVGTCVVPPWDMPADAVRNEPQNAVYAEVEEVTEPEEIAEESPEEELEYLGTFEMTAYEWTGNPCANGNYPQVGYTVACNSLPLGTTVYIEGVGYRVVEDRGADWHGSNWMDLYLGDVDSCYAWGVRSVEVYIVR